MMERTGNPLQYLLKIPLTEKPGSCDSPVDCKESDKIRELNNLLHYTDSLSYNCQ